jgi:hypothetical protein
VQIDGGWLPKIYAAITNNGTNGNNVFTGTNYFNASSNVWVGNFPTNQNLEVTQVGISNLLSATLGATNDDLNTNNTSSGGIGYVVNSEDTNSDGALASANNALGTPLLSAMSAASNGIGSYLTQTIPDGTEPDFTVSFPLAGVSFDANPVTKFPWFFMFTHLVMTWITLVVFVAGCITMIYDILHDYAAAQTGNVPNMGGGGGGGKGTPLTPI